MSGYTVRRGSEAPNARLRGMRKEVERLRDEERLSWREIGETLHVAPNTARSLYNGWTYEGEE